MNRETGGGNTDGMARRRILRPLPVSNDGRSKERDEDLILFRDMYKREKNEVASLLLPVSDEVEANGNYALYRMASGKKGQVSLDYLMTETGKNDYDWLKTPPATPLFPSLDMEANAPELVVQREIPIILPVTLSRFADKLGAAKTRTLRYASPNPKPKVSTRNLTQSGKQSVSSIEKNTRFAATTVTNHQKVIKSNTTNDQNGKSNTSSSVAIKPTKQKDTSLSFIASNLSKTIEMESSSITRPKSRGVSPAGRPKIVVQFPGFSDETPPNLRTDRSLSANRGRPINLTQSTNQRPGSSSSSSSSSSVSFMKQRRQSCSPSVTRGRKQENDEANVAIAKGHNSTKFQRGSATTQVLGSRMVDKFLNARKSAHEVRETKPKLNGSLNESPGFGRHMSRISANMALKNMEIRQDSDNSGKNGTGRKSSNIRGSRFPDA